MMGALSANAVGAAIITSRWAMACCSNPADWARAGYPVPISTQPNPRANNSVQDTGQWSPRRARRHTPAP